MNFAEAWAEILKGQRIRRISWDKGYFLFLLDGDIRCRCDTGEIDSMGSVDADDLMATDWEEA
jgi:hypothetical protein